MALIDVLLNAVNDPISYSVIFFIYVVLAAVILPIPVEIGLFNPSVSPAILVGIMALGKGVGALVVFEIGYRARRFLKRVSSAGPLTRKIVGASESFVRRYGHLGLFIIMSIPLMVDSVSLYLFSLLNPYEEDTALRESTFVLINVGAGAVRGAIILAVFYWARIKLV
ncbi:MAG: hypothetical protein PHU95_07165 [Candidatus Thermoplasmatota archaeon]|nr:hypothetical protein [Candidatus Thermoplasmatota archaeon]MDD5779212.1 hypothetical protein [Candidatus Thermoplasmatota archaeon]